VAGSEEFATSKAALLFLVKILIPNHCSGIPNDAHRVVSNHPIFHLPISRSLGPPGASVSGVPYSLLTCPHPATGGPVELGMVVHANKA
jgi:hypothetical protein